MPAVYAADWGYFLCPEARENWKVEYITVLVLQLYIDWFFGFVCVILEPAQQERTRCASVGDEKQYTIISVR